MRMLIVDDDVDLLDSLHRGFSSEGIIVDTSSSGDHASFLGKTNEYDFIVLDLMLPEKDGCTICAELRRYGRTCPILMLSVNASVEQKVRLLQAGADDYVTKPFSFRELMARVRALSRRPRVLESDTLEIADLRLNIQEQRVVRANKEIYLTRKEFTLLEFMLRHRGQVVSRSLIMEHVWNAGTDPFSNTIEAHILNIRRKIGDSKSHRLLHTVPGRGYRIDTSS